MLARTTRSRSTSLGGNLRPRAVIRLACPTNPQDLAQAGAANDGLGVWPPKPIHHQGGARAPSAAQFDDPFLTVKVGDEPDGGSGLDRRPGGRGSQQLLEACLR